MKHILVVDDDKINLMTAKMALSEAYKVTAVPMGAQALKFLEGNTCDLVLLDIEMPEMNGFEVMEAIQKMEPSVKPPVIFVTGNTDPATVSKCIQTGAMEVVDKPFVKNVLLNRIGNVLELLDYRNGNR